MIAQIEQKLLNYNSQKLDIEEAIRNNDALGQGITSLVETRATPREISKFKFHVEDTEKITNLLVSLSGRLARTEHALASSDYTLESEKVISNKLYPFMIKFFRALFCLLTLHQGILYNLFI